MNVCALPTAVFARQDEAERLIRPIRLVSTLGYARVLGMFVVSYGGVSGHAAYRLSFSCIAASTGVDR